MRTRGKPAIARAFVCLAILCLAAARARAQELVRVLPADSSLAVSLNVPFASATGESLRFDLYRPAHTSGVALPVLIIYNGFGAAGLKERAQQVGWSKLGAAEGMAVVGYDSRAGGEEADLDGLVLHLRAHARELGIDPTRMSLLAWSGHVTRGLGVAMQARRDYLRAAAFLYGIGPLPEFRLDLPVLLVRAGLDNPRLNRALDSLIARGLAANAPITVLGYGGGYHGFDALNDNDFSRATIEQVLAFLRTNLRPGMREAIASDLPAARAAAALLRQDWTVAVPAYRELSRLQPSNADMHLRLGEALIGAGDYEGALGALGRAWELDGRRARDIGYPAAIAAARLGDFARAEPWLRLILTRGITRDQLRSDPNLEGLRRDPRFEAFLREG